MSGARWVITADHITAPEDGLEPRVGLGMSDEDVLETRDGWNSVTIRRGLTKEMVENPQRFRLKDDDGEVYYEGVLDRAFYDACEDEEEFQILKYGEADAGCTTLEVWVNGWQVL